jgi:dTDP-4-amino-4,6-dideoxygalactose transaminase
LVHPFILSSERIVAAMLRAQLERIDAISADRLVTWGFYHQSFAALEAAGFVRRPRGAGRSRP